MKKGKDNRKAIFSAIRRLLKRYQPPFSPRSNFDSRFDLWIEKEIFFAGRERKEMFFSSVIIQSNYVGFYFMPVYVKSDMKKIFGKELLATLKGKSCFHITELTPTIERQIASALRKGFSLYRKRGWA